MENKEAPKPQKPQPPKQEEKKSNNKLFIIIIIILLLLCGFLGWQYMQQKQQVSNQIEVNNTVSAAKDSVTTELLQLQTDYGSLKTNNKQIQAELDAKRDTIAKLLVIAQKHKDDAYIIAHLKREARTLRSIMKGYVVTIDSLNTLNKHLIVERNQAQSDLKTEKSKTQELSKEKQDLQQVVQMGSALHARDITVEGVHYRFGGRKESVTKRAKKVQKLKVGFTLDANSIASAGNKTIYIRVITPDGKEMTKSTSNVFSFGNSKGYFAAKQGIDYANQQMSVAVYCENKTAFVPGKYLIKIYCDGVDIGDAKLTLE